jgi:hypothetical protein
MDQSDYISHDEFVYGVGTNVIGFEVKRKKDFARLFPDRDVAVVCGVFLFLLVLPVPAIPLVAYLLGKWTLLLGFVGALFGDVVYGVSKRCTRPTREFVSFTVSLSFLVGVVGYWLGPFHPVAFVIENTLFTFFFLGVGEKSMTLQPNASCSSIPNYSISLHEMKS